MGYEDTNPPIDSLSDVRKHRRMAMNLKKWRAPPLQGSGTLRVPEPSPLL